MSTFELKIKTAPALTPSLNENFEETFAIFNFEEEKNLPF